MCILQKNLQSTVIVDQFSNFFQHFYLKEVKRRALLSFFYVFQISKCVQ